jgi:hypothetical protein
LALDSGLSALGRFDVRCRVATGNVLAALTQNQSPKPKA